MSGMVSDYFPEFESHEERLARHATMMGFDRNTDFTFTDPRLHDLAVDYGLDHGSIAWFKLRDYLRDNYNIRLRDFPWEAFRDWYYA